MITGNAKFIAHLGYPTDVFKAPMIYNPYFEKIGVDAVVTPVGATVEDYPKIFSALRLVTNFHGALITMPHKVTTVGLLDEVSTTVKVAGSCNAVLRRPDGSLLGDMFDGEGFVRAVRRKGVDPAGKRVLIVGSGGVGSAIAASFAGAQVGSIDLFDTNAASTSALAQRLRTHYPRAAINVGSNDPAGYDVVVNATPLGMNPGDPMPMDVSRIDATTLVGDVVMKQEMTAFLTAAQRKGCRIQIGLDMLYEQIPAYLEFLGLPTATPEELRAVARIQY